MVNHWKFWVIGVLPVSISVLGLMFNIVSFIVLKKSDVNEIFKKLLLTLGKYLIKDLCIFYLS